MKLEELRTAFESAAARLHELHGQIEAAAEDDTADVDALEAEFSAAEAEVTRTKENLDKAEKRAATVASTPLPQPEVPQAEAETRSRPAGEIRVTREELTYERHKDYSYFGDLLESRMGDPIAQERLKKHSREMFVELQQQRGLKKFRAINETTGTGGEFVPPLWLNEQYVLALRAARATADVVNHMPLPEHTNSINFPSVTTGTVTAAQTTGGAVSGPDMATGSIAVPVRTIAGQQDLARQLLERSVPGMDQVIMTDLMADYNAKLDVQVLNGGGSAPNATGILNTASIGSVTYTDASPAYGGATKLGAQIANAVNTVSSARFLPPEVIVMHPRRWNWILSQSDSQNRPLVVPTGGAASGDAVNAHGIMERVAAQARVGNIFGLPVISDPNVPTTLSSSQDAILVLRASDLWLMEDSAGPYTRVFEEVLSGNLQIRIQLFNYFAFTAARYPSAVCKVTGTGLTSPTF